MTARTKGTRTNRLDLFLSDEELAAVERAATEDGVSRSEVLRRFIRALRGTEQVSQKRRIKPKSA